VAWRGNLIANVDTAGARIVIRNNRFRETRSQAILVQGSHFVVQSNQFDRIAGPAIRVHFGLNEWYESISPRNILIENNQFGDCGFAPSKPNVAILFQQTDANGDPISLIRDVRLRGNRFTQFRRRGSAGN
ncbi:MAG: right-handed parallel beta-helix repeat-containing protein, partial [Planctomycetota bacterium]